MYTRLTKYYLMISIAMVSVIRVTIKERSTINHVPPEVTCSVSSLYFRSAGSGTFRVVVLNKKVYLQIFE